MKSNIKTQNNYKNKSLAKIGKVKILILLTVIVIAAFCVRLYKLNNPLADWHSFRQSDTAAVGRNFARNGINLLRPRYDDLSNMQSGKYNPNGYRMVEFPIYNAAFAILYKYFPVFPVEQWGRIVSIFFACLLVISVFYLTREAENITAAFFAAIFVALYPFSVFFTRTVLPETTAISLVFLSIVLLVVQTKQKKSQIMKVGFFIFSLILFSAGLLVKPTTIFFIIPLCYVFFQKYNFSIYKKIHFYIYFIFSAIPLILWRSWIKNFPEGIPASDWLITSVNTYEGLKNVFFKPAFFRWIFFERIGVMILGGYSALLLFLGTVKKPARNWLVFFIGLASILYLFTFQGGNVQHDYYQIIIIPSLAMFFGVGANYFIDNNQNLFPKFIRIFVLVLIISGSIAFSWYKVKDLYNYPQDLVSDAKIINTLTPKNAVIITDTLSDTTLLYLSDRKGFPMLSDLNDQKKHGGQFLVTTNQDTINLYRNTYKIIFNNNRLYIFDLNPSQS